jgi:uncharacterized repeat protein (TIGR03806 family)
MTADFNRKCVNMRRRLRTISASVRRHFLVICFWGVMVFFGSCNQRDREIENSIPFNNKLSDYELFTTDMSALAPARGVEVIEIASTLFTDYAEKQRLLRIPSGTNMSIDGDGLPIFPDGTLIAKTFYYPTSKMGKRQIIETRLLVLKDKRWSAATYRWNANQDDALLLKEGATMPVEFTDPSGRARRIDYMIPSQKDCGSCHRSGDKLTPIGPKARNLNRMVTRDGVFQNQLGYLMAKGVIRDADISVLSTLPNYNDSSRLLSEKARAYLEMNCAHCHRPSGRGGRTSLNLEYETPLDATGIDFNKTNILMRMGTMGEYHMPGKGTTIIDDEGLRLITEYVKQLSSKK